MTKRNLGSLEYWQLEKEACFGDQGLACLCRKGADPAEVYAGLDSTVTGIASQSSYYASTLVRTHI